MKNNIKKEFIAYQTYLTKYFNEFSIIQSNYLEQVFEQIYINLKLFQVISTENDLLGLNYFEEMYNNCIGMLYVLPLADRGALYVYLRKNVEAVIKLICTYDSKTDTYKKTGYRTLKDSIIQTQFYKKNQTNTDFINNLKKYFSELSITIHSKGLLSEPFFSVLEHNILKEVDNKMMKKTIEVNKNLINIVVTILYFYGVPITTNAKLSLSPYLNSELVNKINKLP